MSILFLVSGCLLTITVEMAAASKAELSFVEYVRSGGIRVSNCAFIVPLLVFAVLFQLGVREYRVDERGITIIMAFGRSRTVLWESLAFVGPAFVGQGRFRQKQMVYSRELPRKGRPGEKAFVVNGKTAYALQDSPEMREALRRYCPVYTEEYENVT